MTTPAEVCAQCGGVGCRCGQEIADELRRGAGRSRRLAPRRRSYRPSSRPARRLVGRRRLPSWMVGTPSWMRRRPAWYRPAPPPDDDAAEPAQPPEPAEEPVSVDAPADDATAQPMPEPAAEPAAGDDGPAGGEEELGAWIRRAAAATIGAVSKPTAPPRVTTAPGQPSLRVIQGGGGGGGGGAGGGGDPILNVLQRARMHVFLARAETEKNFNVEAAYHALNSARHTVASGATLTGAQEFFAPLQSAILRAQAGQFMIRPQFPNRDSVQSHVAVLKYLLSLIGGMIRQRQQLRT